MKKSKVICYFAVLMFALLLPSICAADTVLPLNVIEPLPDVIVAGSSYEAQYSFDTTKSTNASVSLLFEYIGFEELNAKIRINNDTLDVIIINNTMYAAYRINESGTNIITIDFSSRIDIEPVEQIGYELIVVTEEGVYRVYSSGGRYVPIDTDGDGISAVSYTHLTLPTILLV